MTDIETPLEPGARRWRWLAVCLIAGSALLHIAYLAHQACPLDLAPDEAHYWDWSRHLDWSYYSKGPLVAYMIRLGTTVAGGFSEQLTDNQMLAVRLPAVLCGTLFLIAIYVLTMQIYGQARLACAAVALALTLPMIVAQSSLMTIDSPYASCWAWALVVGHRAYFKGSKWAWPLAGLLVGVGILAKYTMVLWIPSFALFLLASRERRRLVFRPGLWVLTGVAFLCSLPILIWNAQNDWVTFRHVGGQAGVTEGAGLHWFGPLKYVGEQFAFFMGFWFIAWAAAMIRYRPWKDEDPHRQYLWWLSAPMFFTFFFFGLKTGGGQVNWPVTAYISGFILVIAWMQEQWRSPIVWRRRLTTACFAGSIVLGVALSILMHFAVHAQPMLAKVSGPAKPHRPFPLRRFDPTCRLRGWRHLADNVDRVRQQLRDQGEEPILMSTTWRLPGELGFYCQGNPVVYSIGRAIGERYSQYDCWRPNPVEDVDQFKGQTVIMVGPGAQNLSNAFEQHVSSEDVVYTEQGQPIALWNISVYRNYRGVPAKPGVEHY